MIIYLNITFKLIIWFLLTADFSLPNIFIGLAIAIFLPHGRISSSNLQEWIKSFGKIVRAVPQAYKEAFEIIIFPHEKEDIVRENVDPKRPPGLVFLDIFLITFTPKTIVTKYNEKGWYSVHRIKR